MVTFDCLSVTKEEIFIFKDSLPSQNEKKDAKEVQLKGPYWSQL